MITAKTMEITITMFVYNEYIFRRITVDHTIQERLEPSSTTSNLGDYEHA